jgi:hypothetical protein
MKSLSLFILGVIFTLGYFPVLIFVGMSGIYEKLPRDEITTSIVLFSPHLFPIFGLSLIWLSKANIVDNFLKKLDKQINKATKLEDFNIKNSVISSDSILTIEQKRKWLNAYYKKLYIIGFGFFLGVIIPFLLPIVLVVGVVYLFGQYKKYEQIKHEVKSWLYKHKVNIPGIKALILVDKKQAEKLRNLLVTKRIMTQGKLSTSVDYDELLVFEYKQKKVALIDLNIITGSGKNTTTTSFVCLTTKNPDKISGQTITWSGGYWKFDLPHKVKTESMVFDKIFKTVATSQIDTRLHLKTNVMQDMIDMHSQLQNKEMLFYFDNDDMYLIFSPYLKNAPNYFEFDFSKPILDTNMDNEVVKSIQLCLKIFDDFWLDRKSYLNKVR